MTKERTHKAHWVIDCMPNFLFEKSGSSDPCARFARLLGRLLSKEQHES